jgi:hypothetical protein
VTWGKPGWGCHGCIAEPVLGVVVPVFACEPALCAFQLNQGVGELRVLRASLALVERAAEAGGARRQYVFQSQKRPPPPPPRAARAFP